MWSQGMPEIAGVADKIWDEFFSGQIIVDFPWMGCVLVLSVSDLTALSDESGVLELYFWYLVSF